MNEKLSSKRIAETIKENFEHLGYPDIKFEVDTDKTFSDNSIGTLHLVNNGREYNIVEHGTSSLDNPRLGLMAFCVAVLETEFNNIKHHIWPSGFTLEIEQWIEQTGELIDGDRLDEAKDLLEDIRDEIGSQGATIHLSFMIMFLED